MDSESWSWEALVEYATGAPFDLVCHAVAIALTYYLFAAFSFMSTAKQEVPGPSKLVLGSLVQLPGSTIEYEARARAGLRSLLVALVLLVVLLFLPTSFSFWIRLAISGGALVLGGGLAVATGGWFRMEHHAEIYQRARKAAEDAHKRLYVAEQTAQVMGWLAEELEPEGGLEAAIRLYGGERFVKEITDAVSAKSNKRRQFDTLRTALVRVLRRQRDKIDIIQGQAFPRNPEVFLTAFKSMSIEDKLRCDQLLEEMLDDNDLTVATNNILELRELVTRTL